MSGPVHCRFKLTTTTKQVWSSGVQFSFSPVQGEPFGSATPSATFNMMVVPEESVEYLDHLGAEFDVVITRREPAGGHAS